MTGWVSLPGWLVLPALDRNKGEWEPLDHSPISVWSRLSHLSHLVPFCLGNALFGYLVEFLWSDGEERGVLPGSVTSKPQFLHF